MSLTSHLQNSASPIGQFLRSHFAQTATITKEVNTRLRAVPCIQPPTVPQERYPYGIIGHAIDYRIRYCFAFTPAQEMIAYKGAERLANVGSSGRGASPSQFLQAQFVFDEFFTTLDAEVKQLRPEGRQLPEQADRRLARLCYVLGLFEEAFRSPSPSPDFMGVIQNFAVLWDAGNVDVDQFTRKVLALAKEAWIEDISRMASLFVEREHHLLTQPYQLNPQFAGSRDVGGADADLVVGNCLIDIKSGKEPRIDSKDLRQLVGYTLLDYENALALDSVGVYKSRYGTLFTWPIDEYLFKLSGNQELSLSSLRHEFKTLCRRYGNSSGVNGF